jgi:radical SAM superfamily enzyme YgiQ (UPF0313 family)
MRVVLVHPAGSNFVPGKRDVTAVANRMVPTGLVSIAAYLEQAGHTVFVHDCLGPRAPGSRKENTKQILAYEPELVGFSTTTSAFLDAHDMAEQIKSALPHVKTIFGGVHVSGLGGVLLEGYQSCDYLAVGEGEVTIAELADGMPPCEIDGLVWRDGEEIVTNPPRTKIPQLDDLPFPAYEKLAGFPKGYRLPMFSYIGTPCATMSTSRGCVYQCSYCDRSVFKKGFRSNSAEYTYEHMAYLRNRFGIRHINIYDDLFTTNRKRIMDICERLASEPLGQNFNCAVRIGHTDNELLGALKRAGCLMVSIGVESGDPRLLEDLKAGVTLDQVRETARQVQSHGLRVKGLFMMGVVGETPETIQKTSDFIIDLGLDDMNMSKFTPFPGAPCWSTIEEHGTLDNNWKLMNALNFVFVPSSFNSKAQLDQLYNTHVKRFYTSKSWRRKFNRRLWQHRHSLLYFLCHLPTFLAAKRHFEPKKNVI